MKRIISLLLLLIMVFVQSTPVFALTDAQKDLYDSGVRYFEIEEIVLGDGSCSTAVIPNIVDTRKVAEAIDRFIVENGGAGSPFEGLGGEIVAGASARGVNPFLITALALKESAFGTAGIATQGTFNAFGRTAASGQPSVNINGREWYKWPSWQISVHGPNDEPSLIKDIYIDDGLKTVEEVINRYAPGSDGNDPGSYAQQVTGWMTSMVAAAGDGVDCGDAAGPIGGGGDPTGNQAVAKQVVAQYGWSTGPEWDCLVQLWEHESGWNHLADNPSSTAFGIPQALLGTHGETIQRDYPGYFTGTAQNPTGGDPAAQIRWGIDYIRSRPDYGAPCAAWTLWQSRSPHWY